MRVISLFLVTSIAWFGSGYEWTITAQQSRPETKTGTYKIHPGATVKAVSQISSPREVFDERPGWKELPQDFRRVLADKFNSAEEARNFAILCESTGILKNNVKKLAGYADSEFAVKALASTLASYGNQMGQKGDYGKAIQAFGHGLKLNPRYVPVWSSLAIAYFLSEDCDQAIDWANKVLSFRPRADSTDAWEQAMAAEPESFDEVRSQMLLIRQQCE